MAIICMLSFRRGVGRSLLAANMAGLLAQAGWRVALVDGHLGAPGLSACLGLDETRLGRTLNDFLRGKCEIEQAAHEVAAGPDGARLWLIPASTHAYEIADATRYGYDGELLVAGLQTLVESLALDVLLVDMHAGLDETIIRLMALADTAAIVLRHDQRDYQGTAVMVDVARRLDGPRLLLIASELPAHYDPQEAAGQLAAIYGCPVAGVLPYSAELQTTGGAGLFVARRPDHPLSEQLRRIAAQLLATTARDTV